jgi:hypothetical protein
LNTKGFFVISCSSIIVEDLLFDMRTYYKPSIKEDVLILTPEIPDYISKVCESDGCILNNYGMTIKLEYFETRMIITIPELIRNGLSCNITDIKPFLTFNRIK